MNIIASESYRGQGLYPFYTLAYAEHATCDDSAHKFTPVVICQYSENKIVVSTYDKLDSAKAVFCMFCCIPGLEAKLA